MTASLFKDLARSGWHSSLMTTYSVDPAFYDGSIEYRLRTYGCENNILLADAVMLKRALNATPEAFRNAGRRYAVVPVQVAGCFHPKIHLRLGTDSARLIVGSANATAAGWGSNHEVVTAVDWRSKSDDLAVTAVGPLIRRSYDYLAGWLEAVFGDAMEFKLRLHHRDSPWLRDLQPNDAPIALPDGSAIDIFFERGGDEPGMLARLLMLVQGEKVSRLIVISPYWDANLHGLKEIQGSLGGCDTVVALNPDLNQFPVAALDGTSQLTFAAIHDGQEGHRFLHAKIILIQTDKADHILFGSANCSDDALGGVTSRARNAEVSVYRRFAPGHGLGLLALDLSRTVERTSIRLPDPTKQMFVSGASATPAGSVEIVERSLTWWPPEAIDGTGAEILVGDEALPVNPVGNGQFRTHLDADPVFPMVVRVRFANGMVSDPIIVHDEAALRIASPGVTDRKLRNAFNRVLKGEEDIIDLAQQAHLIFEPSNGQVTRTGRATGSGERSSNKVRNEDYLSPEEFRKAVALKPATGQSGRFIVDDPGLLDLLAIILRGIADVGGREARRREDEDEDADLQAGETEDGDEVTDKEPPEMRSTPPAEPPRPDQRTYTSAQVEKRRSQLKKALSAFDRLLDKASQEGGVASNNLTAQTAFILNLMLFACTKEHLRDDAPPVRLMTFAPTPNVERDLTFAVRAGRMLQAIWGGTRGGAGIMDGMRLDRRHGAMPDDVFYLIVMSRWAIARAYLASMDSPRNAALCKILRTMAVRVYQASSKFGPLEPEAEYRSIEKLDEGLGFSETETSRLVRDCRQFASMVTIAPTTL